MGNFVALGPVINAIHQSSFVFETMKNIHIDKIYLAFGQHEFGSHNQFETKAG